MEKIYKKCDKHGYYADDICPSYVKDAAFDLLEALKKISDIEEKISDIHTLDLTLK